MAAPTSRHEPRMGMPAFSQVLEAVAQAYREQPDQVAEVAGRHDRVPARRYRCWSQATSALDESLLDSAVGVMERAVDPQWGGFGTAPKFPPASAIEFLLRMWRRGSDGDPLAIATITLDGMALGGMYDVLGGGFARYSVDERWLVPHFEKMLYDNALLASAYLHAHVVTGEPRYREVCERTLDFMLRELLLEGGASPRRSMPTPTARRG